MNKGDLTNDNDNKTHARKGKHLVEFNAKNIFQILQKIQNFTFCCQNQFFVLYHLRWNDVAHQAAQLMYEPFNLIQIFPLLQPQGGLLQPALLLFALLSPTHINFTCNVLSGVFVIRYEIMFFTSSNLHVSSKHALHRDSTVTHRSALGISNFFPGP